MVKTTLICDACGEEIEGEKFNRINIKYGYNNKSDNCDFFKEIDVCDKCVTTIWDSKKFKNYFRTK